MTSDLVKKVYDTIISENLIAPMDNVILGLSGGPDSVCLFHVLLELKPVMGFDIICAHVNHMLRGNESDDDERFVAALCKEHNIPLEVRKIDVARIASGSGKTIEEVGRRARYLFFDEVAVKHGKDETISSKILFAHNEDDNAETVLFRIIRGTGATGISGIPIKRKSKLGFEIVRPLLCASRREIEKYLEESNIEARIDSSNKNIEYSRNNIRCKIIPFLENASGLDVKQSLVRLAGNAAVDKDYFDEKIEKYISKYLNKEERMYGRLLLDRKILVDVHPAIRFRIIVKIFSMLGLDNDISAAHLSSANALIESGSTGQTIDFPKGYKLEISYQNCVFSKVTFKSESENIVNKSALVAIILSKKSNEDFAQEIVFESNKKYEFQLFSMTKPDFDKLPNAAKSNALSVYFDLDKMCSDLDEIAIRTRKNGDRIRQKGMIGRKKIQDIMVDEKVPKYLRDEMPLLASKKEVLWLPGLRKSSQYEVEESTEKIIAICMNEQID